MLTPAQVQEFRDKGYLLGSRALSPAQVKTLQNDLMTVIANKGRTDVRQPALNRNMHGGDNTPVYQIVNIWHATDAFRALLSNTTIVEEVAQITGAKQLRVWHDQIQYKPAGVGGPTMWHQDSPLWPPVQPIDEQVTAWIALDDVDQENGCMSMVPGSHKWGAAMDAFRGLTDFTALTKEYKGHTVTTEPRPVAAGQVHYHHGLAWHGSPSNKSGRPRRAIAVHFMTEKTTYRGPEAKHPVDVYITAKAGEQINGIHFPLVWDNGKAIPAEELPTAEALDGAAKMY
jgi:phytanoyl-CoA hydroxylase